MQENNVKIEQAKYLMHEAVKKHIEKERSEMNLSDVLRARGYIKEEENTKIENSLIVKVGNRYK